MPVINFDSPHPSGRGYNKEALNTDLLQYARYAPYVNDGKPAIHLIFEGNIRKFYVGQTATDLYQYIQSQPDYIEFEEISPGGATRIVNMKYVVRMLYLDKTKNEDNKARLTIEFGLDEKVARREASDTSAPSIDISTGNSVIVVGDEADAIWSKYQGAAL
ncbi:MAG: hypothetical protein M3362_02325 [Acidobacteriota bacterium]|nr:hypothetical protein [Acidobacteriota bacterium]